MEKSEFFTQLRELVKADPEFRVELLREIEKISDSVTESEIDRWVDRTKTKTF